MTIPGLDKRTRWHIALALLLGLALRLWFIARYAHISPDSLMYGDIAQNLLHHHIYGLTRTVDDATLIRPTLIRLPGYPLFLAAIFAVFGAGKYTAVMLFQVVLDLATCLLAAATARRLFATNAAFTAALWLGCLCPFMANYTALPLTEVPTLFSIALGLYTLLRWQDSPRWPTTLALAFALAWAVLLRPEQGMLAAILVPAMLWITLHPLPSSAPASRKLRLLQTAAVCTLIAAPLALWTARNAHTFHVFEPLAPRYAVDPGEPNAYGFQRWFRTFAIDFASTDQCYWLYDGDTISIADLPNRAFDSDAQYETTADLLADYNQTTSASPELDARFAALAAERIHADPVRYYLALPVARVLNMILRPRADMLPLPLEWWKFSADPWAFAWGSAYALLNLAYLALAGLAFGRARWLPRDRPVVYAMLATILCRCLLLLTIDNSEPRYTLEFYPVLIILGAATITRKSLPETTTTAS